MCFFLLAEWLWRRYTRRTPALSLPAPSPVLLPRTEELLVALTAGDLVTVPLMPDLGVGVIEWVLAGRVWVAFESGGQYSDEFAEGELCRAKPRVARTA